MPLGFSSKGSTSAGFAVDPTDSYAVYILLQHEQQIKIRDTLEDFLSSTKRYSPAMILMQLESGNLDVSGQGLKDIPSHIVKDLMYQRAELRDLSNNLLSDAKFITGHGIIDIRGNPLKLTDKDVKKFRPDLTLKCEASQVEGVTLGEFDSQYQFFTPVVKGILDLRAKPIATIPEKTKALKGLKEVYLDISNILEENLDEELAFLGNSPTLERLDLKGVFTKLPKPILTLKKIDTARIKAPISDFKGIEKFSAKFMTFEGVKVRHLDKNFSKIQRALHINLVNVSELETIFGLPESLLHLRIKNAPVLKFDLDVSKNSLSSFRYSQVSLSLRFDVRIVTVAGMAIGCKNVRKNAGK